VQHNNQQNLDSNFYLGSGAGIYDQVRTGQVQIADKSSIGQFWAPSWAQQRRVGFAYDISAMVRAACEVVSESAMNATLAM